ncbi:MAG: family 43 glycosylhydrolase, partial [Lachnospiraceae bacterium]|nr:family 43 glycosylhydrolase [Lachnospiraceae bacterium]
MRDQKGRRKNGIRYAGAAGMLGLLLCGCNTGGAAVSQEPAVTPVSETPMEITIKTGNSMNKISCHDPQVLYADGTYYMVGSHQVQARSQDLKEWQYNGNKMFSNIYSGDLPAFAYVGKNDQGDYSVWASNLYYNATMGKYLMYFCTSSTYIKSTLALAVSDTPEGPYTFTDTLLYSGFETSTVDQTDLAEVLGEDADLSRYFKYGGYDNKKWPNCIDPAIIEDTDGKQWMVYGSWSGGLFLLEIDPATGLPIHP